MKANKTLSMLLAVVCTAAAWAQDKAPDFKFKFYGRVRADLSYNTRASQESVDGLFYMFPLDKNVDPNGHDINATAAGNMYMLYTRLGVDIAGPRVGKAKASAKVEADFRGSGTSYAMPRIRHAYAQLDWTRHHLLIGQTWHPMFGDVTPTMLNLSTGAPFQAFSRTPMVRYRFNTAGGLQLSAATLWQMQYNSPGPEGKSYKYLKNSCVPELIAGVDYKRDGWQVGVTAEFLSLTPRQTATVESGTYKVEERVNSLSAEAHVKYTAKTWSLAAKSTLGGNMAHASMLGGYAVKSTDEATGEARYTAYRHSSTWVNFVYGNKWQPAVFLGYSKNLGTGHGIGGATYGTGLNIDQLASACVSLSYNLPHWKVGFEFTPTVAWYGTPDSHGRVRDTHTVTNFRALAVAMFIF